jgi:hypothetical protein
MHSHIEVGQAELGHSLMYLFKREEGIELDQAVKITKQDGYRQEHEVTRIFAKESKQFDYFGKTKHEYNLGREQKVAAPELPIFRTPPA